MFEHQIKELRQFINAMDEKIARYKKQGRNPERLLDNKARARKTIEQLNRPKTAIVYPCLMIDRLLESEYGSRFKHLKAHF